MAHEDDAQTRRRRDRTDDRAAGDVVAYQDENGVATAWTGDEDAPYIKLLQDDDAIFIEGDAAAGAVDAGNPIKIGGLAQALALPTPVDAGDRVDAYFDLYGHLGIIPWAANTDEVILRTDAALAAAGAFVATTVIDVRGFRRLNLTIRYAPGAAGGYPHIACFRAKTAASPALNTDNWSTFGVNDGTVVATNLAGALPGGTTITAAPPWGEITNRPLVLRTAAAVTPGDRVRMDVELDVASVKWVYFDCAERGITATPGILGVRYNLSLG